MEDLAPADRSRPLTFGDLADLAVELAGVSDRQRTDLDNGLRRVRSEMREDLLHAGHLLRGDLAQTRHDLVARIDSLAEHVEALLGARDNRMASAVMSLQLLIWAVALAWLSFR